MASKTSIGQPMPDTVLVAPDSFKGCLPAAAAASAIADGLRERLPKARILERPLADGGEGTLDCLAAVAAAERRRCVVSGVHGRPVAAPWLALAHGSAVIESAQALGLPLVDTAGGPPLMRRGSAGLGELLRAALDAGCRRLVIGLGGSACLDGGLGMLQVLGLRCGDAGHAPVTPDLAGLLRLAYLDRDGLDRRLARTELIVLHDVDNPLCGPRGAAPVFGPQKGLRIEEVEAVDAALRSFAGLWPGGDKLAARPGAGAAGGLGFALAAVGATLVSGADYLIEFTGLEAAIAAADWVVTGEGRADAQTLGGKLPLTVARAAHRHGRRTALIAGAIDPAARPALERHFAVCLELTAQAGSGDAAIRRASHWLAHCGARLPELMRRSACESTGGGA